ncbi:MAG: hypothetical protein R2827_13540 [Bdellovibrionales bacterium]
MKMFILLLTTVFTFGAITFDNTSIAYADDHEEEMVDNTSDKKEVNSKDAKKKVHKKKRKNMNKAKNNPQRKKMRKNKAERKANRKAKVEEKKAEKKADEKPADDMSEEDLMLDDDM